MTDKPYIRLLPQLSPKLAHQGLAVEVNEGEDLELNVVVEAYPDITEHRWHTPMSHRTSTQEHKLVKYNNRYGRGRFFISLHFCRIRPGVSRSCFVLGFFFSFCKSAVGGEGPTSLFSPVDVVDSDACQLSEFKPASESLWILLFLGTMPVCC